MLSILRESYIERNEDYGMTLPVSKIKVIKNDPGDDKFIECAAALKADIVITGDREVLAIKEYMGIKILTPQQFRNTFLEIHANYF